MFDCGRRPRGAPEASTCDDAEWLETRGKLTEPTTKEAKQFLHELYACFETGWDFEEFVEVLLTKLGLDDVSVTARTGDGGIDLTAVRRGVDGLSRVDEVEYVVQEKRYKPDTSVRIVDVRALRGVMNSSAKGIFITTGRFSTSAESFAKEDPSRPILLLDGLAVVDLCIQHKLGFMFKPQFDAKRLKRQLTPGTAPTQPAPTGPQPTPASQEVRALRTITANDIRARIIGVPGVIIRAVPPDADSLGVAFPPKFGPAKYSYARERRYLGGVTKILRAYGLLTPSGERVPKTSEWVLDQGTQQLTVTIREDD